MTAAASSAGAGWVATVNRTGFFGRFSAGAIYEWSDRHSAEFSLGVYSESHDSHAQANIAYRYNRWHYTWWNKTWSPLQLGVFAVRSRDRKSYFIKSPDIYPYAEYYDETLMRLGIEFGSVLTFWSTGVEVAYHLRVLDTAVVALYNNANKDLQYYISSGLALRDRF